MQRKNAILRAILFSVTLQVAPIRAQPTNDPATEQIQKLQDLADQVKAALGRGDLDLANRLSSDLMRGVFKQWKTVQPPSEEKLARLEQKAPQNGRARFYALADLAKAAFDAGEPNKAEDYARELLSVAPEYEKDWNYGNAVFFGNMIVGRVALQRDNNIYLAKSSLLASGQTPGSPQLNSFGPNMSLAKDLLTAGERDSVLQFFDLIAKFWKMPFAKLEIWTATVRGGGIPDFGANLNY